MNSIIYYIKQQLNQFYPEKELMAVIKLLLAERFGFTDLELYGCKDRSFSKIEMDELNDIIERLKCHEPVQYILGNEYFLGMEFKVTTDVLIPRPETAQLVQWIEEDYKNKHVSILDIGTGSGCIAISLASKIKQSQVTAWDISEKAIDIALTNSIKNSTKVDFFVKDIFSDSVYNYKYDVIVSNPPYITPTEKTNMDANVLEWEPSIALFVPQENPLLYYIRIADVGREILNANGYLYFEINREFGFDTMNMLKEKGYSNIELRKDIFGNDRMIKAKL